MATKTLTITESAYKRLAAKKKTNESFSEVINRLAGKESIREFAGLLTKTEGKKVEKTIKLLRKRSKTRLKKLWV